MLKYPHRKAFTTKKRRKQKTVNVSGSQAPASRDWKLELPGLHSQVGEIVKVLSKTTKINTK
jgi:hypothetical protein